MKLKQYYLRAKDKAIEWQWEDIVDGLPKDCEIYDRLGDLETVTY